YLGRVARLHALASSLVDYYDAQIRQASGKSLRELPEELRKAVLGGLKPDGTYSENAYALFIKDFFGLSLEDPKLYVAKQRLGAELDVKVVAEESLFVELARLLRDVSGFVLRKARELGIEHAGAERTGGLSPEDLVAEVIKASYELSVGVNEFATGVWGLRKTTPSYMKKAYEDVPKDLLTVLGFSKLISLKEWELWGFPDYFTKCTLLHKDYLYYMSINGVLLSRTPVRLREEAQRTGLSKPETLGGAICALNELVWRLNGLLYKVASKWYEGVVNIESKYIGEAWKSLKEIGWDIPEYLQLNFLRLYATLEEARGSEGLVGFSTTGSPFYFLEYREDGLLSEYIHWVYRGSYDRSGFVEVELKRYGLYIFLQELFNDLMPAIFLGAVDTTLYLDGRRALLILVRTGRGD
ncbi:MAG: hypothetical protein ACP5KA_07535, partial [Desulfurococcaceae archaeon]